MLKAYPLSNNIKWLLGLICFFGIGAVLLGQDINWDLRGYHFYNGFAFLHHRYPQDIMPASMQTYLNPYFDVITYLLIQLRHPRLITFLLGAVSGINAFLVFQIARNIFSREDELKKPIYSLIAMMIGVTGAGFISLLGTTTNDTYSTVMVLTAFYFYLVSLDERPARFFLAMSGLLIGTVVGLKLTNASYFIGLSVTLFFFELTLTDFLIYGFCSFIGFFLVSASWMYPLYLQFGNPIFPFYNNFFHSSYMPYYSFNLEPGLRHISWICLFWLPLLLILPNTHTSERLLSDPHFLVVAILLMLTFVFVAKSRTNRNLKALTIFFIASYMAWCVQFHVYRYALPLEMTSGILIVALLKTLFKSKKLFFIMLGLLMIFTEVSTHPPNWGRKHLNTDYIAMQAPKIPEGSVVVFLSRPLGYVVPFFNNKSRFIGLYFVDLGAAPRVAKDTLMLAVSIRLMREAALKGRLYGLSYTKDDIVSGLSYAILLSRKIGPTPECEIFGTSLGDKLKLCKLRLFEPTHSL